MTKDTLLCPFLLLFFCHYNLVKGIVVRGTVYESSVDIDKEHLAKNPECGYVPEIPNNPRPSSRISNAKKSDKHYPWVIKVERRNTYSPRNPFSCGGSIITQTAAITASHCICGIPEELESSIPKAKRHLVECLGGTIIDFRSPQPNEVRYTLEYFNSIRIKMGNKDWKKERILG